MTGRIEQRHRLRAESPPDDAVVVIRGGPDTTEKLAHHADRTARAWTLDGRALHGVSVFCALDELGAASLDGILAAMSTYRVVYLCPLGELREAGLDLLPTATRPHFTLFAPDTPGTLDVERLLAALGTAQPNPFYDQPSSGR
jgi:hypothetical protein